VDRYPGATRVIESAESFEKVVVVPRFGTEGSEVQILSPRPISKENREIQSAGSLGSSSGFESRNRVVGASNPAFI